MAKIKAKLVTRSYIGTRMAAGSKKPPKDTLSMVKSDDNGIAIYFYGKK